jgi:hypothetical protein
VAVLEGDASLVERAFAATLTPAELDELQEAMTGSFTESEAAIDEQGVPEILTLLLGMPYEFGPSWMDVELFGPDGRDLASSLGAGLPSTAQILGLRTDRVAEVDVDTPELPEGAEQIETDTWGAFSWVVPLASYVDVPLAGAAAEAWVGDTVLVHRIDDRVCVDATVQLADDAGATAFSDAATDWFAQLPAAAGATTERSGQQVRLHTCDPGPDVEHDLPEDAADSLGQLALQNAIVSDAIVAGAPEDTAECFAQAMIDRFGVTPLLEDDVLAESPDFLDAVEELRSSCRT